MPKSLTADQQQLVVDNLDLARLVAWEFRGVAPRDWAEAEAGWGLVRAAQYWMPGRYRSFRAIARLCCRQAVRRGLQRGQPIQHPVNPKRLGKLFDRDLDPEASAVRAEAIRRVGKALGQLSASDRALAECVAEGDAVHAAAGRLGIGRGAAWGRWARLSARLRLYFASAD
jgi:hypothetical protein